MTRKHMKMIENYANGTMEESVPHEDEILTILNMTPKTTTRRDRMLRKRKAKEHDLEIVFFGKGKKVKR